MQRLSRGPKLPLLRARSFRFDRRCRSLSVSATRPVRHSAPLRLSMIARSHEVDLVDTWRADSQSLSVARLARNYPMCRNALPCTSGHPGDEGEGRGRDYLHRGTEQRSVGVDAPSLFELIWRDRFD